MTTFKMPSLGADMEEGKLVEWLVSPGDSVAHGDVIAVVETHKGAIEIEIFEAAVIDEFLAETGQTLPVGAPLARIHPRGENPEVASDNRPEVQDQAPKPAKQTDPVKPAAARRPKPETPRASPSADATPLASPAARKLADRAGVELGAIAGTGPGGAILLADVRARIETPDAATQDDCIEGQMADVTDARPHPAKPGLDMAAMRQ
ncbi:biotin/lipoyl-containing protein, partial [Roseinatronobacter monicus]|uniref:biotin/lipoyl-containing protein n=1 Tax=Roseinatronobacter monicus TaxID=393481 RepID=UPI003F415408